MLDRTTKGETYRVIDKRLTARKGHRCSRCGKKISPGSRYVRRTYQFYAGANSDYFNGAFCEKCAEN